MEIYTPRVACAHTYACVRLHVETHMSAHIHECTNTHSARQNNKCAALLCAGFDNVGE